MNWIAIRIVLDFAAVALFMLGLAYWWLDNKVHEFAGTAAFLLLALHNVFNRRWWGGVRKSATDVGSLVRTTINLSLAVAMLVLLGTSVMISRSVFSFLPIGPLPTAREIHIMAAYWALVAISIHLGMHWSMIVSVARRLGNFGNPPRWLLWASRAAALLVAGFGAKSAWELGIGSKLLGIVSLDFWDFNVSTVGFFAQHAAVVSFGALMAHYVRYASLRRR